MHDLYSPERRTALVLTGTGADGAYHAGVLRALHEAGVKIDLVCGRGVGAVGARAVAVDGAAGCGTPKGLWRAPVGRGLCTAGGGRFACCSGCSPSLAGVLASPLAVRSRSP